MNRSIDPRLIRGEALIQAMQQARSRTLADAMELTDEQWRVPYHPGIQPVAWDLAHIGWFCEFWLLRGPHRMNQDGTVTADAKGRFFPEDAHYDSARIDHPTRWRLPLYDRAALRDRLGALLEICCARVADGGDSDAELFFPRLALYHELMHQEALSWTRDLLGWPAVEGCAMRSVSAAPPLRHSGGELHLGRGYDEPGFAFDNEVPGANVELAPFTIDAHPVTCGAFLAFVEAGGYADAGLWPQSAARFRSKLDRSWPERWRRRPDGAFEQRRFDHWQPLALGEPVIHISAYEAEAYCNFIGRRLPRAAEWEAAAHEFGADFHWGRSVWEWTADPMAPYPGFRPGPYSTYTAPWFHWQREMRGGAFATDALMHDRRYRNFFLPQRTDIFAGFRTASDAS